MVRKRVDDRVGALLWDAVVKNHRALLIIVGDHGRDQVVNLHATRAKLRPGKPSVVWCYKKELGFTTHRAKRLKQIKKRQAMGSYDNETEDPFWLFQQGTSVRYCRFRDSEQLMGNTYDMAVIQDFEALTPNLICRTFETVRGGGLICLLLRSQASLRQLFELSLDAHKHFRSSLFDGQIKPRFCQRLILSLTQCSNCLVLDDELNVLPLSMEQLKAIPPLPEGAVLSSGCTAAEPEDPKLTALKTRFVDHPRVGPLVKLCRTLDQAECIAAFADQFREGGSVKEGRIALTAARGRGKSAALGLAIALAVTNGVRNIFVTAPSPDNTTAVFDFAVRGLKALGYAEHDDFLVSLTPPEAQNEAQEAIVDSLKARQIVTEINVRLSKHPQSIRYVFPTSHRILTHADILLIDEAAAIPTTTLRGLMGPYLVLLASTVDGYEGTGYALTKEVLGRQNLAKAQTIKMTTPIRYSLKDPIEAWLNKLLGLDIWGEVCLKLQKPVEKYKLSKTQLYRVNRDALFAFHATGELLLKKILTLFASTHHKNSPDDLLRLSDSAQAELFVLCPTLDSSSSTVPDILCAIEIAYEGGTHYDPTQKTGSDLVPFTIAQYFSQSDFTKLTGARITKLATHHELRKRGFASKALKSLMTHLSLPASQPKPDEQPVEDEGKSIISEVLRAPAEIPPLLESVADVGPAFDLDWAAATAEMTDINLKLTKKVEMRPVWVDLKADPVTNRYGSIFLAQIRDPSGEEQDWVTPFNVNFGRRFVMWLDSALQSLPASSVALILEASLSAQKSVLQPLTRNKDEWTMDADSRDVLFSETAMKRLEDFHRAQIPIDGANEILYLPAILYLRGQLPGIDLTEDLLNGAVCVIMRKSAPEGDLRLLAKRFYDSLMSLTS